MTTSFRCARAVGIALILALSLATAGPAAAQQAVPDRLELRQQLLPVYRSLVTDPTFLALRSQLRGGDRDDPLLVDRYLTYLPMSPKEMLELEMYLGRFEIAVPRFIMEWHQRWIELHPERAREHYGPDAGRSAPPAATFSGPALGGPLGLALRAATVATNRNLAATFTPPPNAFQGEIQVVVNPNDPNQLVAAANTWNSIPGTCSGDTQAVFYSSDGGVTWGYTCSPDDSAYSALSCGGTVFGSDPALFWNDNDEVFLNHMLLCFSGGQFRYSIVVARSADGGATWSGQGVVINSWGNSNVEDKNFYAIDNNPASPFYQRHYTCWDRNNNEKLAYSADNGQTWTEVNLPTIGGAGTFDLQCEMEVEDDGTVHIVYNTLNCGANCFNERMFYARSTNGGVSWSTPVLVKDFNLVGFSNQNCPGAQDNRCIHPFGALGIDNSGGDCDGILYAAYSDWTSGGVETTDIFVSRSTDGGASWQTGVKVNDDGLSGAIQFHPFLQVDQSNGAAVVAWQDARNDPANHEIDYFVARSTDCGLTYEANVQASAPTDEFNNNTISWSNFNTVDNPAVNPNQTGEYLGLDVLDGKAYIAWTDTRHYFPLFPGEPQDENLGFTVVTFDDDVCEGGDTLGDWQLPVGNSTGYALGKLLVGNTSVYGLRARVIETAPGQGNLVGVLVDGGGSVVFDVSGTWQITIAPGTGTFTADILTLGSATDVGDISGRFRDDPTAAVIGKYRGTWEICQ